MVHESYSEQNAVPRNEEASSYVEILRELGESAKDLVHNELALITSEFKKTVDDVTQHVTQMAFFAGLLAVSVLPFLAFLIIGLGDLMGGQYAWSSLIVSVVCALLSGTMVYRSYGKFKTSDLALARTSRRLLREKDKVQNKVQDVTEAATGDNQNEPRFH